MDPVGTTRVESESIAGLCPRDAAGRQNPAAGAAQRNSGPGPPGSGPGPSEERARTTRPHRFKLLHEVLERQAIRRIDAGSLTEDQIERLGVTLMGQAEEIDRLRKEFGLEEEDLNLDLGPLGKLL